MILTDAEGHKYWAHFRHVPERLTVGELLDNHWHKTDDGHIISKMLLTKLKHRNPDSEVVFWRTECSFHGGECPKRPKDEPCSVRPIMYGAADCSPLDRFDRNDGRKLALARAIKELPKPLRAQLWASYLMQRVVFGEPFKVLGGHARASDRSGPQPLGR